MIPSPRSLRGRLTLTFAAVAGGTLLVAGVGAIVLIDRGVWGPFDAAIAEEVDTVRTLRDSTPAAQFVELVGHIAREPDLGPQKFLDVLTPDGQVVAGGGFVPPPVVAARDRPPTSAAMTTILTGHAAYRVLRQPDGARGWIEIGVRADRQRWLTVRGRAIVASAAVVLFAALTTLAWTITGRATAELERIAVALEPIEAGSLDQRLRPATTIEVDRLVSVLNRVLARLDAAVAQLRRFTADAAHELRTPVAALRAHLEVALRRPAAPSPDREALVDALEQVERLRHLAEDLLVLSAMEADRVPMAAADTVRLDQVVAEVGEALEPVAAEQGRRFSCRTDAPAAVRGRLQLLKRLVLNLVDNALRHTPAGAAIAVSVDAAGRHATLRVHDDGPGIAAADLPHVFGRFYRGRGADTGAGTGLGLALCKEIVTRHGGTIALASEVGRGTTVTVTIPLADPAGVA